MKVGSHNVEVRNRVYCQECRRSVPERDFATKYASAGGVLTGPFCSSDCYWAFLVGEEHTPRELREHHYSRGASA